MTTTTIDEMRERIADFWEQDEHITVGEYYLLWVPAPENWLLILPNGDLDSLDTLANHLAVIEDEFIIDTYNEYIADMYDEEYEEETE
jgi:hypothetical protein